MRRKEVTHSDGSYEKRSRRWAWLTIWEKGKIPWYTHRLVNRKRVTCELHDSYFRLMTIKHAIPKIEWAIEILYNSVKTGSQWVGDRWVRDKMWQRKSPPGRRGLWDPRLSLETRWWQDAVEKASIQQRGLLGLRLSSPGEQERHNADGHKSGGQYVAVLFGLQLPLKHTTL